MSKKEENNEIYCSFCGKKESEVKRIISGNNTFICNECIELCNGILSDDFLDAGYETENMELPKPKEIKEVLDQYVVGQDEGIECSCISMKHLGEYLDLHCGGIDNAFPHHTNEIAQSEAYLGHEWCNYWFHVLHLNTNSGKMSKSKGEFLTVSLLEEKGYNPIVYRYFCLLSHYRKSLVFSWENLDNAVTTFNKLIAKIKPLLSDKNGEIDNAEYERLMKSFTDALDNDLNTSLAITAIYDVLKSKANSATKLALIEKFDEVLCLDLIKTAENAEAENTSADIPQEVLELVEQRKAARQDKNFALADEIRDKIAALGYEVKETRQGTEINKL